MTSRIGLVGLLLVVAPARADSGAEGPDDCLTWRAFARYAAYGYDHWVELHNGCRTRAVCKVATNVRPEPQTVRLDPGADESVLMWRGSPASAFETEVTCDFRK